MKPLSLALVVALVGSFVVHAQDVPVTETSKSAVVPVGPVADTRILDHLADGSPASPAPPKPALPPFEVKSTVTRLIEVEEAPPMAGLPPVQGTITQTVQLVEDPGLPDPPPPPPAIPVTDAAVLARMAAVRATHQRVQMVCVSAMIYDHSRTFLRWHLNGEDKKVVSGWSNLDFNHFGGFGSYQVKGQDGEIRQYSLFMGVENTDTQRRSALLAKRGLTYTAPTSPALPDLADAGPAFVITEGDATDKDAMDLVQGLHDLYRAEGVRMAAAYHARIKASEDRRAYLIANPPKPEDVTVRFWDRSHPARPTTPSVAAEGGDQ